MGLRPVWAVLRRVVLLAVVTVVIAAPSAAPPSGPATAAWVANAAPAADAPPATAAVPAAAPVAAPNAVPPRTPRRATGAGPPTAPTARLDPPAPPPRTTGAGPPATLTPASTPPPLLRGGGAPIEVEAPVDEPRYTWPLRPPPPVLTPFGAPEDPFGPGHRGVDLAGTVGQPVLAARGGTVVFAGLVAGKGVVSVQHDDGLRTTYEPLMPVVLAGAVVATGDVLGALATGHRGCASACLHWGVRRDRLEYLDPLVLLRPPWVRLLPVPDPWPDP